VVVGAGRRVNLRRLLVLGLARHDDAWVLA
jgi:hypothetical protein